MALLLASTTNKHASSRTSTAEDISVVEEWTVRPAARTCLRLCPRQQLRVLDGVEAKQVQRHLGVSVAYGDHSVKNNLRTYIQAPPHTGTSCTQGEYGSSNRRDKSLHSYGPYAVGYSGHTCRAYKESPVCEYV